MSRILALFLLVAMFAPTQSFATTKTLLSGVIATGAGAAYNPKQASEVYTINQVMVATGTVSASTGAATVKYQCSLDNTNWIDIGTATLTLGTAATSDKVLNTANYKWCRANVATLSGTNATINVLVNY